MIAPLLHRRGARAVQRAIIARIQRRLERVRKLEEGITNDAGKPVIKIGSVDLAEVRPPKFAVIKDYRDGEDMDAARDRHFAAHPEDRGATLVVFIRKMRRDEDLPSLARLNREAVALSSGHASLRLHQTVPAVEGGPTAFRPALGSRNQARRLSADGAPGWPARPLLHPQRQ